MRNSVALIVVITVSVAVLSPVAASAQEWLLDIYGGWSYSNLTGGSSSLLGGDYKSGFGGGVGGELKLNEDWGWEFGLWYVQKGTQGVWGTGSTNNGFLPDPNDVFDGTVSLDYVELPILVNVYFPVGDAANIRGYIGPAFAFLVRSEASGTLNGTDGTIDVEDKFDDADITVMIGAGGQWDVGRVNVLLDFRWDIGTTNISKVPDTVLRTSTILVTAGIGIPITSYDE
jgi:opacity protein-like surface antigen